MHDSDHDFTFTIPAGLFAVVADEGDRVRVYALHQRTRHAFHEAATSMGTYIVADTYLVDQGAGPDDWHQHVLTKPDYNPAASTGWKCSWSYQVPDAVYEWPKGGEW